MKKTPIVSEKSENLFAVDGLTGFLNKPAFRMGRNYFTRPSAVIAEVGKVELGRKIRDTPKKVVVPSSKSITNKHVFAGKLGPENDISEMPRSASAVMLFSPNDDMGEAF
jgi:hypothetical protein